MFKKLFLFAMIALFFAACNTATQETGEQATEAENQEIVMMSTADFLTHPEDYVGKEVVVDGIAIHVCQHGGKRMFIVGDETEEERIQVKAGDNIDAFDVELEGSDITLKGVVDELRIDEPYLTEWENELKADNPESEKKIHRGEEGHEHHEGDVDHEYEQIVAYREQMKEKGVDHLSFYSIIVKEYKEKK